MAEYRWNQMEMAAGYDAAAAIVHPHYRELQDNILQRLPANSDSSFLLVDAGAGSGTLVERALEVLPNARALLVDQSEAFLTLAQRRLERFGDKVQFVHARLQEDWTSRLSEPAGAIVSMSAIHHLDPAEKQSLYRRCYEALGQNGIFMNGDEVRAPDDTTYLAHLRKWATHMREIVAQKLVSESLAEGLRRWEERNVDHFGEPRQSGDDCHETAAVQCEYLRQCGFQKVEVPWQKDLWALLVAVK